MPPRVVTWLIYREPPMYVAQCCETDIVVQGASLQEVKKRAAELLRSTEYLRLTYREGGIPKPYPPALDAKTTGSHVRCVMFGLIPIVARFKTPWPTIAHPKHGNQRVVNPDLYRRAAP